MSKEIARIEKNSQEEIIVQLTTYKGHDLIDIRAWVKPIDEGEVEKPTKKGLSLNPGILPELIDALQKADRVYQDSKGGLEEPQGSGPKGE